MLVRWLMITLTLTTLPLESIEIKPWFGRDKEAELRLFLGDAYYPKFQDGHRFVNLPSHTFQGGASLGASPTPDWNFEAEVMSAATRQHSYLFDYGAITARYLLLNDVIGDPVGVTVGATVMFATRQSLHDYSLFHSGEYEYLAHISVGRESSCESFWTSRWWSTLMIGFANRGAPWTRFHVEWEKNWCDLSQFFLFADVVAGWGSRDVNLNKFLGYGPIQHRALDIGAGYRLLTDEWGTLGFMYAYRPYAHNRPANVQQLLLTWMMPISLTSLCP
jgi:hypothetical protein